MSDLSRNGWSPRDNRVRARRRWSSRVVVVFVVGRVERFILITFIRSTRVCFPVVGFGNRIPTSSRERERERRTRCIHPAWTDGRPAGTREDRDTHTRRERERGCRGCRGCREREREWILIHTVRLCRRIASGVVASGGIRPRTRHTSSRMDGWMDAARFPRMDGWMRANPPRPFGAFHPIVRADLTTI